MDSKFAFALSGLRTIATGVKASSDTEATLTLLGITNKFQLNRLATTLMGLSIGDRVRIIAGDSKDINSKFFIAKTTKTDVAGTAKISKANSANPSITGIDMTFNYAGVWSVLLQGDADAVELGYEALAAKGLVIKGETKSSVVDGTAKGGGNVRWRATKNVKMTLVSVGEHEVGGVVYDLYVLTDYVKTDKTKEELESAIAEKASNKAANVDADEEEEEEEDEEVEEDDDDEQ